MSGEINLIGKSSGKKTRIDYCNDQLAQILMDFLRSNSIPIASSCRGEGICKKCKVNSEILSCQLTLAEFLSLHGKNLTVDYL